MIYDYLLTAFKVIVGLITTERLIYGAAIAIGFYVIWACFSLALSFQRKFNRNCVKLYNYVKKNNLNANDANSVDYKASLISSGFSHGWKKFKSSANGKPSDFINRRDALDVEVNGGILNQGKTFMRAYINVATFILFLFNFAYLGKANAISCYLIAEAMVLPLMFFVVCKVFYFLYTSIKQQIYKTDIESLYELLELLDSVFGKASAVMYAQPFVQGEDVVATTEGEELAAAPQEEVEEHIEAENEQVEEVQEEQEDNIVDKYDIFKKKNIDVDKLMNEMPNKSTSLPYINVDSDYVIKDDEAPAVSTSITNLDNGSAILGGMMQDMSSIKKTQKESEPEKTEEAPAVEEKTEETPAVEEKTEDTAVQNEKTEEKTDEVKIDSLDEIKTDSAEIDLSAFDVSENKEETTTETAEPEPVEEVDAPAEDELADMLNFEPEPVVEPEEEEVKLEIPSVEPIELPEPEPIVEPEPVVEPEEISEEQRENIATVVGSFRPKSKLASGGVIIERNEPIARREKSSYDVQNQNYADVHDGFEDEFVPSNGITQLSAEQNTDNILNSFRSSAGGFDEYQGYGYGQPQYTQPQGYAPQGAYGQGYGYNQPQFNQPQGYASQGYQQPQNYGGYQNQPYNAGYEEPIEEDYEEDYEEEVDEVKPAKKTIKRSKEDEPRPRNLKKKESKAVMAEEQGSKRGRPKKQVFDETVTIKNDKEFDEVLSRAEKLMKKSESGLSASQAKRIEKELKMLMDAMNKYKEGV